MNILCIEPLESRIAPAAVTVLGKTATWLDWDGDQVTMKWTGATAPDFSHFHVPAGAVAGGIVLDEVIFHNAQDSITVSVKAGAGGDGQVALGYMDATGLPLKSFIAPKASVLEFDCGDGSHAIGTLRLAGYGTVSPASFNSPGGDGTGTLEGAVSSVKISGNVFYGAIDFGHDSTSKIGSVAIGGSLLGDTAGGLPGGQLVFNGPVAAVFIGGDIVGGSGAEDGRVRIYQACQSLTVGGSVIGGTGDDTGEIFSNSAILGTVAIRGSLIGGQGVDAGFINCDYQKTFTILGNVIGGSQEKSGCVFLAGSSSVVIGGSVTGGSSELSGYLSCESVGSLAIGGDIAGGSADFSGVVLTEGANHLSVGGSIVGGAVTSAPNDNPTGALETLGDEYTGSIHIGRDLVAGSNTSGKTLTFNGAILTEGGVGSITMGGSIQGDNAQRAFILAQGSVAPASGNYDAIGKLSVGGSVNYAVIASGHDFLSVIGKTDLAAAANPDAGIGPVTIGGNYVHSSLMAGIDDNDDLGVGEILAGKSVDTASIGDPDRLAILGPVIIRGQILDDAGASGFSGFEGQQITSISAGGQVLFQHGDPIKFFDFDSYIFAEEIAPA